MVLADYCHVAAVAAAELVAVPEALVLAVLGPAAGAGCCAGT